MSDQAQAQSRAVTGVYDELWRARRRVDKGQLPYCVQDKCMPTLEKLRVLTEETGEVAKGIRNNDLANLQFELTQVAAVALGWLVALDGESEIPK